MPQSVFSMEQPSQQQPTIRRLNENARYVGNQLQHRQGFVTRHEDGTQTVNYEWINVQPMQELFGKKKHISYQWDCPEES